ncbi:MAG: hypothetical protein SOZ62_01855 [Eubacteriales bacterium]|nr:hypothetical protein [Eubacteriales bacterium]
MKKSGATIIKHVEDAVAGYIMKYTLFEERADRDKLYDMIGDEAKRHKFIYSVKIETVSSVNPSDRTITSLPDMSVNKEESKRLIDFLCENSVSADSAYDMIDEINSFLLCGAKEESDRSDKKKRQQKPVIAEVASDTAKEGMTVPRGVGLMHRKIKKQAVCV